MDYVLSRYVTKLLKSSLDSFFANLSEFYEERRKFLKEAYKGAGLAIDYVLNCPYGPTTAEEWLLLFTDPTESRLKDIDCPSRNRRKHIQQILLIYLRYDLQNNTTVRVSSDIINKISNIPSQFIFPRSIIRLATSLWAIDNADASLLVKSISLPSLDVGKFFEQPGEFIKLILSILVIDQNSKIALQICNMRLHENWDENHYVQHSYQIKETSNLVSVAGSTCDANSQTSGRRTPSKPRNKAVRKTISFEDSPARNTRRAARKGKTRY